jgi:site-specific recombinase XerD
VKSVNEAPRVSTWDFRFLNAWVQGVEIKEAWDRYMGHRGSNDLRHIRSTVRTMLDVLAAAAKRHGDVATATVLKRDPLRIKASAVMNSMPALMTSSPNSMTSSTLTMKSSTPPTLDQFRDELEDPDFYSEAELGELWEQKYGKVADQVDGAGEPGRQRDTPENRATKRKARLVQRQMEALRRLESLVATKPYPDDLLEAWLDAETAKRLASVGVLRIRDLVAYLNRHGFRWYRRVPRIGVEGAKRLTAWLGHHEASVGRLEQFALKPVDQLDVATLAPRPTADVVPIERLVVPVELSGADGANRKPVARCKINATNDYQAVCAWLDLYKPQVIEGKPYGNRHTWSAYRKEAERFLLWSIFERGKALSSLDSNDCAAYLRFLEAPGARWVAAKGMQRWSEAWRPFEGPLGPRSLKHAEGICKMLCRWLAGRNYLDTDPWAGAPRGDKRTPMRELRALTDKQAGLVEGWLAALPRTEANLRLQVIFELALKSGLRKEELANAEASWLRKGPDEEGLAGWSLQFYGKGKKERKVPLLDATATLLFDYLAFKGLDIEAVGVSTDISNLAASTPLLSRISDKSLGIPPARVYELVKTALGKCAESVEPAYPAVAKELAKASTHWLRHTFGRVWADRGGDMRALGELLGHANPATTAIYTRADEKLRRKELMKVYG